MFDGLRYDTGDKADYLRTVVRTACDRDDLRPGFVAWLKEFEARLKEFVAGLGEGVAGLREGVAADPGRLAA